VGAAVVPFDVVGTGTPSASAQFNVGQVIFGNDAEGGGVYQDVLLSPGSLSVTADIASEMPLSFCNDDGGTVTLLVDGVVADQHAFGRICGPTTARAELNGTVPISSAGTHEVRVLVTRVFGPAAVEDYVDNVAVSGTATLSPSQLAALLGGAVAGVGPGKSLGQKVAAIDGYIAAGDQPDACSALDAFASEVDAQTNKKISVAQASSFMTLATAIEADLGC
jgi:hypothetical protein